MKQITSILIGAGLRGGYVYSQYALDHPDEFKVIAVAEPDQERRELFAAKHNIPKELQYESYEELLQQDKMADCAMICTQDKMHYEPVTMAMQKGYHVLCEKPMSPDKEEIIKMGAMAKKYDRILSVCHVLRYSPFFSKIKEILEENRLAASIYITVDTLKYLKTGGRITPAAAAIGTVLNLKPELQIQGEKLDAFAKARTVKQAKSIMIEAMKNDFANRFNDPNGEHMYLEMAYTHDLEAAENFKKEVQEAYPGMEIRMDPLSLSISCHIGPGALAVACSRKIPELEA